MNRQLLQPLLESPDLPYLLEELQAEWEAEQKRRHAFWAEVDEGRKAEFILGEVIYHSPVYGRHWMVSTNLCTELLPFVKRKKLGKVAYEKVMVRMTRNDYEPDICFWRTERAREFQLKQSAFPPPDFVVEIISNSTEARDRGIKFQDYALHGVAEYWIIDPESCTLEQYLLEGDSYQLAVKLREGQIKSTVIDGFSIALEDLFRWEDQ